MTRVAFSLPFCVLALFAPAGAQETLVAFKDVTTDAALQISGGAACWFDLDNDGWIDLCTSGGVWWNEKGEKFSRIANVGTAVAADFNNDGFADLFSWSELKLYRNDAGKRFTPVELPDLPKSVSRGACWGDFNGDALVDLYVGGYEDWNAGITWPSLVLMNIDGKSFRLERTDARYRARGVTACDFDQDADLDVYVSNYRLQPNLLWLSDGSELLAREAAKDFGVVATSPGFGGGHSIGAAWGDFDNDGLFDLFAGNFAHVDSRGDQPKSRFLKNLGPQGDYKFQDRGTCGVQYQESYASPSAGDFDNDGDLDLFFTTVYATASFGRKNYPVLFRNDGQFAFVDVTETSGLAKLGPTYQAAWADYDRDGDLDLVSAGKLFQNQGSDHHWLHVKLAGDGAAVNRSALGSQVRLKLGDTTLTRQVEAGTGEGNQNDLQLHFGLGEHDSPVTLEVFWADGTRQTVSNVAVNSCATVRYEVVSKMRDEEKGEGRLW